jgi:hypothetical protein
MNDTRKGAHLKEVSQLPDYFPFVCLNFILTKFHLTDVSDLVDHLFVLVGEVKHIISGIPASTNIMGHHPCIKGEGLKYLVPLRKCESTRILYCKGKFANLRRVCCLANTIQDLILIIHIP